MNAQQPGTSFWQRFQWGSYGFLPGLVIGILLGWVFSGVVSWIVRLGVALLILIPLVLIFLTWRWWTTRDVTSQVIVYDYAPRHPADPIDTRSHVVDVNMSHDNR